VRTMLATPGVTQIGRRMLDLAGWEDLSIWGWDAQMQTLFAQLWRNGEDRNGDDPPDFWISPPRYAATAAVEDLARWIAAAAGIGPRAVLQAMAETAPGAAGEYIRGHLADAA
jgi:hypothetical protein